MEESGYAGFLMPIEVYFKNKVRQTEASCCFYGSLSEVIFVMVLSIIYGELQLQCLSQFYE